MAVPARSIAIMLPLLTFACFHASDDGVDEVADAESAGDSGISESNGSSSDASDDSGSTSPETSTSPESSTDSESSSSESDTTDSGDPPACFPVVSCVAKLPRVMVLLDASSSMLNVEGGSLAGGPGETLWDQARSALTEFDSLFDVMIASGSVDEAAHVGLAVFGHNAPAPGQQKIAVQYGPCAREQFIWALDPYTACEMPGCDDPYGGPPITWTFKDGTGVFGSPTFNHMPSCDGDNTFCSGAGTYTHLGLQLIKLNQMAYLADPLYPTDADAEFINIIITDGQYTGYSTNAQVQTELEQMYAAGIVSYVVGLGDGVDQPSAVAQLQAMADWGSGGALDYYDANTEAELRQALASIAGSLTPNPC